MADIVHREQEGEWIGYVWRRKEAPDQTTQYYWSLSFSGDVQNLLQQKAEQDGGADDQAAFVPDSTFYPSEDAAKQDLHSAMKRQCVGD
ncbi:MAG: hypothetical protein QOH93_2254 [Chloroflexia bacterium]|jgi:hypothetical protein|nr:hypothetical protein [Chloroflexia bacterium]